MIDNVHRNASVSALVTEKHGSLNYHDPCSLEENDCDYMEVYGGCMEIQIVKIFSFVSTYTHLLCRSI